MEHNELGKKGEEIARKWLINKSYLILETNWRHKGNEVDIIARLGNIIVVVEVKSRSSDKFNQPHDAVGIIKQRSIIRVAESYIYKNKFNMEVRFDIISVIFTAKSYKINHIENAFYPLVR